MQVKQVLITGKASLFLTQEQTFYVAEMLVLFSTSTFKTGQKLADRYCTDIYSCVLPKLSF